MARLQTILDGSSDWMCETRVAVAAIEHRSTWRTKQITLWYKAVINFVHEHKDILSRLTDNELTTRTIKQLIQESHEPRCIAVWRRTTRAKQQFQYNTLWKSKCNNMVKEFVWKLTHQVLTTKAYLRT